ncbi:MAG TPA: GNAT family acetyltransferase [Synergistaceae bacterium]|nr:GNAT family acetyltransferase [Synergistaceae bacterium]HPJ26095.1 GNAT family acetyltransferase [Synergistaceae bacterium]HPQ36018.1 GNAT family acetyltransferase [Synergistaceae bacterium]
MNVRAAVMNDIERVLALQELNLVTNLSEEQKKNGFVTTPLSYEQVKELVSIEGLAVIEDSEKILGYAVAAGWSYFEGRPMFDYMLERFRKITYREILITPENSYEYGPVCVDTSLRGTSAFPKLFAKSREMMAATYLIGTTFINKVNERSFQAHTRKAKLDVIDEFEFNGNDYYGLAFLTR